MNLRVKTLIKEAFKTGYTYSDYRVLVEQLVLENKSTGVEQTEALSNYSMLNHKRMQRLDKTTKLSEEVMQKLQSLDRKVVWVVLTESWCGDEAIKEVIDCWGPRPSIATNMVKAYKEKYGSLTAEFKQDLQIWYNKDRGENTIDDLLKLLSLK